MEPKNNKMKEKSTKDPSKTMYKNKRGKERRVEEHFEPRGEGTWERAESLSSTPPLPPRTPPSQLRTLREPMNDPAATGKARAFRNIYIYIYL